MRKMAWIGPMLALLASQAHAADWPKRDFVAIVDDPDDELCVAAAHAVKSLYKDFERSRLADTFRRWESAPKTDTRIADLTFYALRDGALETLDDKGERRSLRGSYYLLDLDNDGVVEMIGFVSGGHLRAGWGDTLTVMKQNLLTLPQPVRHALLWEQEGLEIGPLELSFTGPKDFDPGFYVFPIAFKQRNYLLLEGNGEDSPGEDVRRQVLELVPGTGLVGRCFF